MDSNLGKLPQNNLVTGSVAIMDFIFFFFIKSNIGDPGLDIGYVPAGPDAFFRWSGQFGPQQLIFYWPAGPVTIHI